MIAHLDYRTGYLETLYTYCLGYQKEQRLPFISKEGAGWAMRKITSELTNQEVFSESPVANYDSMLIYQNYFYLSAILEKTEINCVSIKCTH